MFVSFLRLKFYKLELDALALQVNLAPIDGALDETILVVLLDDLSEGRG